MMNLVVLSNKQYERDFRKYMLTAAQESGSKVLHISYDANVILTYGDGTQKRFDQWSNDDLTQQIKAYMGEELCLVLFGYGDKITSLLDVARKKLSNLLFIYDVYDDFRYGAAGIQRIRQYLIDRKKRNISDMKVVLDEGMRKYYKDAFFLFNASHMPKLDEKDRGPSKRLVYIGSLDERIDFEWLAELTNQDVTLDIYGYFNEYTETLQAQIEDLLNKRSNVNYYGAYDNNDLPEILKKYHIGVVPYKSKDAMTKHINPDKIYHYLNAGLEIVSTPFPQSVRLARHLHLMRSPTHEWDNVFKAATQTPRNTIWPRNICSWERRWEDLINHVLWFIRNKSGKAKGDLLALCAGESPLSASSQSHDEFIKQDSPKLIHLGCGTNLFPGWLNTDLHPVEGATQMDFSKPFPFPDGSIDAMFCEHTIEHISKIDAYKMLSNTFRALKVGGKCRIVTPSLANMAALAVEPESDVAKHYLNWFKVFSRNPNATIADAVNAMFYEHGHCHIFSTEELAGMLTDIGYTNVRVLETGEYHHSVFDGLDSHGKVIGEDITRIESFAVEAEKS